MKRSDFLFTIGYQGDVAIVDRAAAFEYGSLNTSELIEKGLFKAAFCSALYSEDQAELVHVMESYNQLSGASYKNVEQIKRLFGVYQKPLENYKIKYI